MYTFKEFKQYINEDLGLSHVLIRKKHLDKALKSKGQQRREKATVNIKRKKAAMKAQKNREIDQAKIGTGDKSSVVNRIKDKYKRAKKRVDDYLDAPSGS